MTVSPTPPQDLVHSGCASVPAVVDSPSLRQLAEAATPGPWRTDSMGGRPGIEADGLSVVVVQDPEIPADEAGVWGENDGANNAAYIAAANPQAILALLDERDALRAALDMAKVYVAVEGDQQELDQLMSALNGRPE